MKRCTHDHVVISEEGIVFSDFEIINQKIVFDYTTSGFPTGKYIIHCQTCGLKREFTLKSKWPKWAKRVYEAMRENDG